MYFLLQQKVFSYNERLKNRIKEHKPFVGLTEVRIFRFLYLLFVMLNVSTDMSLVLRLYSHVKKENLANIMSMNF